MVTLYNIEKNEFYQLREDLVLDDLYFSVGRVPTIDDFKDKKNKDLIKKYFGFINPSSSQIINIISEIKKSISKINYKVPLYDEITRNMYIIDRRAVYSRVVYQHYRFPDNNIVKKIEKRINGLNRKLERLKNKKDYKKNAIYNIHLREERKFKLMLAFLDSFDLVELKKTYYEVFYTYSNQVGREITVCKRPSFTPHLTHIDPYYKRSELINMGLNMGLAEKLDDFQYTEKQLNDLCETINENDINAKNLIDHQKHIVDKNKIGIIQYYSLQGSYYMNTYLRDMTQYDYKNKLLEKNILSMWKLINNAPKFDKDYILYRFVHDDSYIKHLKIGENFISSGFLSTTRDPFYRSETYRFGFILIKIKIPKDKIGVALCIETFSQFPKEQEIILPPLSILKLENKDKGAEYYHTDENYVAEIKTRYEFTYVGKKEIKKELRNINPSPENINKEVDFMEIERITSLTLSEKMNYFVSKYLTQHSQFSTKIGDKKFDIIVEPYDSTTVYKDFYAMRTMKGFSMYTLNNDYITFMLEIGEKNGNNYMYVNYYFRYSTFDRKSGYSDNDLIIFLSKLSYYFNIQTVLIYCDYLSCSMVNNDKTDDGTNIELCVKTDLDAYDSCQSGNYCKDYYNYLKYKKLRFSDTEIKSAYSTYQLDRLYDTNPRKILKKRDRDEIYQIYTKSYKPFVDKNKDNLADFYIWLIDNHCIFVSTLVDKMERLYGAENNPFNMDYYVLKPITYLYNKNLIDDINYDDKVVFNNEPVQRKEILDQNTYRLDEKLGTRQIDPRLISIENNRE